MTAGSAAPLWARSATVLAAAIRAGERLALAAARDIERACGTVTPIDPR